ncbi:MAG: FAD-binding oxidoreductase [Alphaproteobacteria bacterium]|nr:FAD-binding oxidoreductase [Alphaproteobacteria bacterium]
MTDWRTSDVTAVPPAPEALERIKAIVGPKGWSDDPLVLEPLLLDRRGLFVGKTALLVRPASTQEVSEVVRVCAEHRIAIVPQGGNTGLVAGGIPHEHGAEILLNLSRMKRVRMVDPADYTMTVEAGCVLADIQAEAEKVDRLFPLSLGAEGSCQIGGNISTNAGGVAVLHYGNMRELVLGLEVVLPDGQVWDGLRGLRKDNTGYDIKQLFIGGEGTLGVVTAAVLKLFPLPRDLQTAIVALRDLDAAIPLLAAARTASGDAVTSLELIPRLSLEFAIRHIHGVTDPLPEPHDFYVLVEFSGARPGGGMAENMTAFLEDAFKQEMISDAVVAQSEAQRTAFWRIREAIVEAQLHEGGSIKHDVSVPADRSPEFIRRAVAAVTQAMPGIRPLPFGHIGDGNIHLNLSQPEGMDRDEYIAQWPRMNRIVHDIVADLGGSISAEHGIGRLKREQITRYKSELEIDLMRRIKAALDPGGIMNPGKVV